MSPSFSEVSKALLLQWMTLPRSRPFSTPPCHWLDSTWVMLTIIITECYYHFKGLWFAGKIIYAPDTDTKPKSTQNVSSMISYNKKEEGKFQAIRSRVRKVTGTQMRSLTLKAWVVRPGWGWERRHPANPLWISSINWAVFTPGMPDSQKFTNICLVMKNQCLIWLYQIRDLITGTLFLITALPLDPSTRCSAVMRRSIFDPSLFMLQANLKVLELLVYVYKSWDEEGWTWDRVWMGLDSEFSISWW